MKGLSILSPAAIPYAAFIGAAGPVAAMKYEFYRTDLTSHLLGWGFDTMGQYQAMSAGAVAIASAILFLCGHVNAYAPIGRKHHRK